ncbi:MAG: hypothetical protein R3E87_26885 [Burkholderiaceae bacterium]
MTRDTTTVTADLRTDRALRLGFASRSPTIEREESVLLARLEGATGWRLDTLIVAPGRRPAARPLSMRAVAALCRIVSGAEQIVLRRLPGGVAGMHWRARSIRSDRESLERDFATVRIVDGARASIADDECPTLIITRDEALHRELHERYAAAHWLIIDLGVPASLPGLIGFDAVFDGDDRSGFRIRLVRPRNEGQLTVLTGGNRTKLLAVLNRAALWDRLGSCLQTLMHNGLPTRVERSDEAPAFAPACAPVTWTTALRLLAYPAVAALRIARIVLARRQWSVAVGVGDPLAGDTVGMAHLQAQAGRFYADPQLERAPDGRLHCFVEEFDHALGRARIAVLAEQPDGGWQRLGIALDEPHHLSFPYLFRYQGQLYMCPEAYTSGRITVYRCTEFPLCWEPASVIMDDVCAADSMLVEHGGMWWLLTNIDNGQAPDHQAELHVFHAVSPLATDWRALPANPVKVDPRGGRNGGLFVADGALYRCGQKHSIDAYGKGLALYRITTLDVQGFSEAFVCDMPVPASLRASGTHTLSVSGGSFAIDVLR